MVKMKPKVERIVYLKYKKFPTETTETRCPKCGCILSAGPNYTPNFCSNCGQALDFTSVKWEEPRYLDEKEVATCGLV